MFNFDIVRILLTIPGILIGLAFHEFAHGYVSYKLGDPTPKYQGRLTLSPLAHIDPIGFLLIVIVGFGWAKPVQINTMYYKNKRRDEILVSIAGPLSNLLIAIFSAFILKLFISTNFYLIDSFSIGKNLMLLISYTIWINIILFLFNLIPIPPLDGFHVFANLVTFKSYKTIQFLEQYGQFILILLIITKATSVIIGTPAQFIYQTILRAFGL